MSDAHLVQLIGDGLCIAVAVEEGVGDDKDFFLAHDVFQFIKSDSQAALFDIEFFGGSEPEHVFSPFGDGLDVHQVFDTDIFGDGVASPGTAAECERGCQLKIVKVAYASLGRGRVD